ncbi:MAG: MurT ligase domain-containing protein [Oscillospiraceae bacterium]
MRLFNFGATSLPGALALKICPDILGYAAKNVDIIAVTGTNGKTTSARIIERALQNAGRSVCANRSGANLMPGITAELIMNKSLFGSIRCESAVIECDEAACRLVLGRLRPRVLLITNLFRDQLDRYGTVAHPRDCIAAGLRDTPETIAVINADCPMAASVSRLCQNKTVYYGLGEHKKTCVGSGEDDTCPVCGKRLCYKGLSYANLGVFSCSCGFARSEPDVSAESVFPDGSFVLRADGDKTVCAPALPGLYNVYNSVGAVAAAVACGVPLKQAADAAQDFDCGFGRMESFPLGKRGARMILIKNAAAADQTLNEVCRAPGEKTLVLAVNDRTADGTDISWLDEADFGVLARRGKIMRAYVCGDRAEAAEKRLKRENIPCQSCGNYDKLIESLRDEDNFIFILPTYTAMLELRAKLVRRLGGKNFWE